MTIQQSDVRKPVRYRDFVSAVILTMFGCLGCLGCLGCFRILLIFMFAPMEIECFEAQTFPSFMLEDKAMFKLPPSAQGMKVTTKSGSSWCDIGVRFEMQPNELSQFVNSTRVGSLSSSTQPHWFNDGQEQVLRETGMNLESMKSYLFGSINIDGLNQQFVLVDTSDPKIYAIYLVTERAILD